MSSALEGVGTTVAQRITAALWRGESCASIARDWGMKPREVRACRDELFAPLSDPKAVKELAQGPIINAQEINRPKAIRRAKRPAPQQIEMFE